MKPVELIHQDGARVYSFAGQIFAARLIKAPVQVFEQEVVPYNTIIHFKVKVFSGDKEVDSRLYSYYPFEILASECNVDLTGPFLVYAMNYDETSMYIIENPKSYKGSQIKCLVTSHLDFNSGYAKQTLESYNKDIEDEFVRAIGTKPYLELSKMQFSAKEAAAALYFAKQMTVPASQVIKKLGEFLAVAYLDEALCIKYQLWLMRVRLLEQNGRHKDVRKAISYFFGYKTIKSLDVVEFSRQWLNNAGSDVLDSDNREELLYLVENSVHKIE